MSDTPAKRPKKPVSYSLDPALLDEMDKWIASHPAPPSKTAIMEIALREFFERHPAPKPAAA